MILKAEKANGFYHYEYPLQQCEKNRFIKKPVSVKQSLQRNF